MEDEKWIGPKIAACMWIYTKAAFCRRCSGEPPLDLDLTQGLIVYRVTWVTERSLWEQEWNTDTNVTLREDEILEALNYEIDVPCPLQ